MRNEVLSVNGTSYVRKNRAVAKALWECGFTVWMCPSNQHPSGIIEMTQTNKSGSGKAFEAVEDEFRSDAFNAKRGRWIKFYVLQPEHG